MTDAAEKVTKDVPSENMVVRHFRGLFLEERPAVTKVAIRAILEQLKDTPFEDRAERILGPAARGDVQLVAATPGGSFAPDVVLLKAGTSECVAVFEWKVGAAGQATAAKTVEAVPALDDAEATAILEKYAADPLWVTTQKHDPGVWQLDAYRSREWWEPLNDVEIKNPDDVVWLLAHLENRQPATAFPGLVSVAEWATLDAPRFMRALYSASLTFENPEDRDAVAVFGWGLWSRAYAEGVTKAGTPEGWADVLRREPFGLTLAEKRELLAVIRDERSIFDREREVVSTLREIWEASGKPQEGPLWDELCSRAYSLDDTIGRLGAALATLYFGARFSSLKMPSGSVALNDVNRYSAMEGYALSSHDWVEENLISQDDADDLNDVISPFGRNPAYGASSWALDDISVGPWIDIESGKTE
jgi:hypothetical protein